MDVRGVGEWSGWKNSQSSFERANRDTGFGLTYFENSKLRQWNWGHGSGNSSGSLLDAQPPATNWRTEVIRTGLALAAVQVNTPITIPIKRMQPLEQNYYLEWGRYVKWPHLVWNLGGNHRCIAHESQCLGHDNKKKWPNVEERKGANNWPYWVLSNHCGPLEFRVVRVWCLDRGLCWGSALFPFPWNWDSPTLELHCTLILSLFLSLSWHQRIL